MNDLVVCCRGVSRTYQEDAVPVHALVDVDFDVARGEFVSLAGPSGSGKSTLLNVIGGLDRPDAGTVEVDGVPVDEMAFIPVGNGDYEVARVLTPDGVHSVDMVGGFDGTSVAF